MEFNSWLVTHCYCYGQKKEKKTVLRQCLSVCQVLWYALNNNNNKNNETKTSVKKQHHCGGF